MVFLVRVGVVRPGVFLGLLHALPAVAAAIVGFPVAAMRSQAGTVLVASRRHVQLVGVFEERVFSFLALLLCHDFCQARVTTSAATCPASAMAVTSAVSAVA